MKKYKVEKQTYNNMFIEDVGILTIDEIRELAHKYIDDVFSDNFSIDNSIEHIKFYGEESWLTDEIINGKRVQISIEEVSK